MALSSYIILLAICLVTIFANHIHANKKNKHELFFDDLKDVYQQGKSYTGLLYKEGKMNVKVTNLKIFEVEANLDEPKKGGETLTGTDLTAKLTFSFDELLLENTIIDAPFIKKREFNYRITSECDESGIYIEFALSYNIETGEFSHDRKQSVLKCKTNEKEKVMPLLLHILPGTGKKNRLIGKAVRKVIQATINKFIDGADNQGSGNFGNNWIKGFLIHKFAIPEIIEFAENPYAGYTMNDYFKKFSKKGGNSFLQSQETATITSLNKIGKKDDGEDEPVTAGKKFHRYIAWQIMQQKKTFKLILPGSKLDLNNKKKQGKQGNEVCLFKPIATMHHFDVGKINLKLTNYYDNGKMNIFLDLDGFKGEIKYHKKLNSMLDYGVKKLEINWPRDMSRESMDKPWIVKDASALGQWTQCTMINSIFPIGGGRKQSWKEYLTSPSCTTSALKVTANKFWNFMRL